MPPRPYPRWMGTVLRLAGAYNLVWGTAVILAPTWTFAHSGLDQPGVPLHYPQLWQCIGMIVGVYGVGYLAASTNPLRHWPVVLVGFLGKVFGPLGLVYGIAVGQSRWQGVVTCLFNDLVWLVPFALILRRAYLHHVREDDEPVEPLPAVLAEVRTDGGRPLAEVASGPTLLVFLRHLGCTYCREAVADLAKVRKQVEADGTRVVLVHTADPADMAAFLPRYGLGDVPHVADPAGRLYRAAGLRRATLGQWLWSRTAYARFPTAGIARGHGVGWLQGDGLRLAGLVLLDGGRVVRSQRTASTGDPLDFCGVAGCKLPA